MLKGKMGSHYGNQRDRQKGTSQWGKESCTVCYKYMRGISTTPLTCYSVYMRHTSTPTQNSLHASEHLVASG